MLYSYLIDRAAIQSLEENLRSLRQKEKTASDKLLNVQENLRMESENLQILRNQYEELRLQLHNDETERRLREIEEQMAQLEQAISRAQSEYDKAQGHFNRVKLHFDRAANDLLSRKSRMREAEATTEIYLDSLLSIAEQLRQAYDESEKQRQNDLLSIVRLLSDFKEAAAVLFSKSEENLKQTEEALRSLRTEKESLEKGRFQFPQNALNLKQAIISQIKANYGETAEVVLVAEAAEIRGDRWRNAIEGYLNTQKFYIIVPPQYVRLAVRVFDRIKREKNVYGAAAVCAAGCPRVRPHQAREKGLRHRRCRYRKNIEKAAARGEKQSGGGNRNRQSQRLRVFGLSVGQGDEVRHTRADSRLSCFHHR